MRWLNAVEVGDVFTTGPVLEASVGVKKTLAAVRDAYQGERRAGRAEGVAGGVKNSGSGNGLDRAPLLELYGFNAEVQRVLTEATAGWPSPVAWHG